MPRRSTINLLPDDVRKWLDKALVGRSFSGYEALAEELAERGFAISRSALQRHGQKFEEFLVQVKHGALKAAAIAEALPDDAGHLGEAVTQMLQTKIMDLVVELDIKADDVKFTDLVSAVAKLNASSVQQKKWSTEVKAKTKIAAEAVVKVVREAGMSDVLANEVRTKILGITK